MDSQLQIQIPYDLPRNEHQRSVIRNYLKSRKPYFDKTTIGMRARDGADLNLRATVCTRHGHLHLAYAYWKRMLQFLHETAIIPPGNAIQLAGAYVHRSVNPRIFLDISLTKHPRDHAGNPTPTKQVLRELPNGVLPRQEGMPDVRQRSERGLPG